MSVDLDQMGAELEKLKEKLGVCILNVSFHPTFCSVYLHHSTGKRVSSGDGDSLKEALADALADRAIYLRENSNDI